MKRLTVFAHFDKNNLVDDYVTFYLKKLSEISQSMVFVTTAQLSPEEVQKVQQICQHVIVRENTGYDFYSYKTGLLSIEWDEFDEILICNDSTYGPFCELKPIVEKMSQTSCDFWGMTSCLDKGFHIQSYFMMFKQKAFKHPHFRQFWEQVDILHHKQQIIDQFEVGLSKTLIEGELQAQAYVDFNISSYKYLFRKIKTIKAPKDPSGGIKKSPAKNPIVDGIKYACCFMLHNLKRVFYISRHYLLKLFKIKKFINDRKKSNITHFAWKEIIEKHNMPFIKIELLRDNPCNLDISDYRHVISERSDYNSQLIDAHLSRMNQQT